MLHKRFKLTINFCHSVDFLWNFLLIFVLLSQPLNRINYDRLRFPDKWLRASERDGEREKTYMHIEFAHYYYQIRRYHSSTIHVNSKETNWNFVLSPEAIACHCVPIALAPTQSIQSINELRSKLKYIARPKAFDRFWAHRTDMCALFVRSGEQQQPFDVLIKNRTW